MTATAIRPALRCRSWCRPEDGVGANRDQQKPLPPRPGVPENGHGEVPVGLSHPQDHGQVGEGLRRLHRERPDEVAGNWQVTRVGFRRSRNSVGVGGGRVMGGLLGGFALRLAAAMPPPLCNGPANPYRKLPVGAMSVTLLECGPISVELPFPGGQFEPFPPHAGVSNPLPGAGRRPVEEAHPFREGHSPMRELLAALGARAALRRPSFPHSDLTLSVAF